VFTILGVGAERDLAGDPRATKADADRVERYQDLINLSIGITAAAAVTSVVLYFATPSYSTDRRTLAVAPVRDGWGAFVVGRF
jgi:hypothetical protein